jgi:hypothetical protein
MIAVTEQQTEEAERFVPIEGAEWPVRDAAWRSSTQLEILAWELARYEPELAKRLAEAGVRRLQVR